MRENLKSQNESGYALIVVLVFISIAIVVTAGSLSRASTDARIGMASKLRASRYYEAEEALGHALAWMRANSQRFVDVYWRDKFYSRFERSSVPTVGSNDTSRFTVPTKVKSTYNVGPGSTKSFFCANTADPGAVANPGAMNIVQSQFAVQSECRLFYNANNGYSPVRFTLIDAYGIDKTKDTGAVNPEPGTDFYPVYRFDAMTSDVSGAHISAIYKGVPVYLFDFGLFGEKDLIINQACDAYDSSVGPYSALSIPPNRSSSCHVRSSENNTVQLNNYIYGTLHVNGDVNAGGSYPAVPCGDFSCSQPGDFCKGTDCDVPKLYEPLGYAQFCTNYVAIREVSGAEVWSGGPTDSDHCIQSLVIDAGGSLTLSNTSYPYIVNSLTVANGGTIIVAPSAPVPPETEYGTIKLIVTGSVAANTLKGSQISYSLGGAARRPTQFHFFYHGSNALTLDLDSSFYGGIAALRTSVTVIGGNDYYGSLVGESLYLNGAGKFHYDVTMNGSGKLFDFKFESAGTHRYFR